MRLITINRLTALIKTHFSLNIKKRALCSIEVLQIKFNYNISIYEFRAMCQKYVNGFVVYLV